MNRTDYLRLLCLASLLGLTSACDNDNSEIDDGDDAAVEGDDFETDAILDVKTYINDGLSALADASEELQAAAPDGDDDGWNVDDDATAVADMRDIWAVTRDEYESIEGAIAILFEDLDTSTDQRYDAFIEEAPDDDLFDDEGVTGMHAIERILWANSHPANVVDFESKLDGYEEAAYPATQEEADQYKSELSERLVTDTAKMRDDFKDVALDADTAFNGVIGSMAEQVEKVTLANSAADESRYAQRTLDDMRANLAGGLAVYEAFSDWVKAEGGAELDADIKAGFAKISAAYEEIDGPAIPSVPEGFDPTDPSEDDLETEYGKLWSLLTTESDPEQDGSLVALMIEAGTAIGIELE